MKTDTLLLLGLGIFALSKKGLPTPPNSSGTVDATGGASYELQNPNQTLVPGAVVSPFGYPYNPNQSPNPTPENPHVSAPTPTIVQTIVPAVQTTNDIIGQTAPVDLTIKTDKGDLNAVGTLPVNVVDLRGAIDSPNFSPTPSNITPNQSGGGSSSRSPNPQPSTTVGNTTIYRDNNGKPIYVRG